jgi:serine protease Do
MRFARSGLAAALAALLALAPAARAEESPEDSALTVLTAQRVRLLEAARAAVVGVRAHSVEGARSNDSLGSDRRGSGVLIGADGLVLTIGYLILEADHVDIAFDDARVLPARVVAYDIASGFGLLRPLAPVQHEPARLGNSSTLAEAEPLMVASGGEEGGVSLARLVSRRDFSGYWEYHIEGALFTAPPRTDHSGAALFNAQGELIGVGSLVVRDALGPGQPRLPGNMFVPVDLLKPILDELQQRGATRASTRAWLGVNSLEHDGVIEIVRVTPDSPAERAGVQPGDRIVGIDGTPVANLEAFYKALWQRGEAERTVQLELRRRNEPVSLTVQTADRMKTLRQAQGI